MKTAAAPGILIAGLLLILPFTSVSAQEPDQQKRTKEVEGFDGVIPKKYEDCTLAWPKEERLSADTPEQELRAVEPL
jgi:hypothetical protein